MKLNKYDTNYKSKRLRFLVCILSVLVLILSFKIIKLKTIEELMCFETKENTEDTKDKETKPVMGIKEDFVKYSYNASEVFKKLDTYDYRNHGEKIVFLTFDDGTSTTNTPKILDVLEAEGVKATFFITGQTIEKGGEEAKNLVKRQFESGHAIGNHSWSHSYKKLYPNRKLDLEAFKEDFEKTDKLLKEILGENFETRVIRCPGGTMSWKGMDELKGYLQENNKVAIDWNALNKDAEGKQKNARELYQEAVKTSEGKEIVVLLMHDTYGKEETVKALPSIIKHFKDNGYIFKTLS
ncbi:polysaccharide deacetylase family protein [Paraclostridium bifermentans]|uniref:polysaccharide deacetylase family protein n=1 Tax=Paraclostridium bifermentans TaxID=1490 RepID=UPI00359C7C2D